MNIQQTCDYLQLTYPKYNWKIQSEVSYCDTFYSFDCTKLSYWVGFTVGTDTSPKNFKRASTLRAAVQLALDAMMLYEAQEEARKCTLD